MYSFPDLEPVCSSVSSSNCCFLTCIQISQEAGKVVWYSHILNNFPQFVVIHTLKGFGIVNKVEVDVFLKLSCFFNDPMDIGILISGSSAFSKSSFNIWKFIVHILLKPGLENFEHYFASVWDECNCVVVEYSLALVIENTLFQQRKKRLYTWTSPDGPYWNQIDYMFCSQRWRSSIQSAKIRPGDDCGSDHEVLIAKFKLEES